MLTEVIRSLSIVKIHRKEKEIYQTYILLNGILNRSFMGLFSFPPYVINPKFSMLERSDVENFNFKLSLNAKAKRRNHFINRDVAKRKR